MYDLISPSYHILGAESSVGNLAMDPGEGGQGFPVLGGPGASVEGAL